MKSLLYDSLKLVKIKVRVGVTYGPVITEHVWVIKKIIGLIEYPRTPLWDRGIGIRVLMKEKKFMGENIEFTIGNYNKMYVNMPKGKL